MGAIHILVYVFLYMSFNKCSDIYLQNTWWSIKDLLSVIQSLIFLKKSSQTPPPRVPWPPSPPPPPPAPTWSWNKVGCMLNSVLSQIDFMPGKENWSLYTKPAGPPSPILKTIFGSGNYIYTSWVTLTEIGVSNKKIFLNKIVEKVYSRALFN